MPTFADYEEFEDELVLPIRGRKYTIPPINMKHGIMLQRMQAGEHTPLNDMTPEQLLEVTLGTAYKQMLDDDVPTEAIGRAHLTALALFNGGPDIARKVWDRSADPELGAALTAATIRKTTTPTASTRSRSTAAAAKTPSPARSSGTRSRKTTQPAKPRPRGKA